MITILSLLKTVEISFWECSLKRL